MPIRKTTQELLTELLDRLKGEPSTGKEKLPPVEGIPTVAPLALRLQEEEAEVTTLVDIRTLSRKAYMVNHVIAPDAETFARLPIGARKTYYQLQKREIDTVKGLMAALGMNRKKLDNALSELRKIDAILEIPLPRR